VRSRRKWCGQLTSATRTSPVCERYKSDVFASVEATTRAAPLQRNTGQRLGMEEGEFFRLCPVRPLVWHPAASRRKSAIYSRSRALEIIAMTPGYARISALSVTRMHHALICPDARGTTPVDCCQPMRTRQQQRIDPALRVTAATAAIEPSAI
jgi:hypothetical protein